MDNNQMNGTDRNAMNLSNPQNNVFNGENQENVPNPTSYTAGQDTTPNPASYTAGQETTPNPTSYAAGQNNTANPYFQSQGAPQGQAYANPQYAPNPQQIPPYYYNQPVIPEEYKPISTWGYVGYQLLFAIPCVGLILAIVYACTAQNVNVRNYSRGLLCMVLIGIGIGVLISIFFAMLGMSFFDLYY